MSLKSRYPQLTELSERFFGISTLATWIVIGKNRTLPSLFMRRLLFHNPGCFPKTVKKTIDNSPDRRLMAPLTGTRGSATYSIAAVLTNGTRKRTKETPAGTESNEREISQGFSERLVMVIAPDSYPPRGSVNVSDGEESARGDIGLISAQGLTVRTCNVLSKKRARRLTPCNANSSVSKVADSLTDFSRAICRFIPCNRASRTGSTCVL